MKGSISNSQNLAVLFLAAAACAPWLACRAAGVHPAQPWTVLAPGLCIFGAAFLLTWGAEAAEMDIPQSISIGLPSSRTTSCSTAPRSSCCSRTRPAGAGACSSSASISSPCAGCGNGSPRFKYRVGNI